MPRVSLPERLEHISALDGLRGLAILMVLPHNMRGVVEPYDGLSRAWVQLTDRGWIGVQLFFVLSGFLITRILLNTQTATNYYSGFYARRALRIMPLYYATLILWLVIRPAIGSPAPRDTSIDGYLWVFLSNWVQPFHPAGSGLAHLWSLAVEEQFYLFWPLAVHRLSPTGVLRLCGALTVISFGVRAAMVATDWPAEAIYEFTPCRMDALALGGAVAALLAVPDWRSRLAQLASLRWSPVAFLAAGAAFSRGYRQTGPLAQTFGYTLLATAFAAWILTLGLGRGLGQGWLRTRLMRTAGKYSYGVYVIHFLLGTTWGAVLAWADWKTTAAMDALQVLGAALVAFALAFVSYHLLEMPFLRWKDRFEPCYLVLQARSSAAAAGR